MLTVKNLISLGLALLAVLSEAEAEYTKKTTKTRKTTTSSVVKTTSPSTTASILPSTTTSAATSTSSTPAKPLPSLVGIVVYPGFTVLDVFGPLEVLNQLSLQFYLNLTIIAETLDPVSSNSNPAWFNPAIKSTMSETINPTHTFDTAPPVQLLIILGGIGTRAPINFLETTIAFVKKAAPTSEWVLSVCTGSGITARAGVLDGKRATTNKRAWATVLAWGPLVRWVAEARWVVDGNLWSSSGVSAGTDATLAWVAEVFGTPAAQNVANGMEWVGDWRNSTDDPFAKLYNLTSANNTNGG